jgi:hypothetical protein
VLLAEVSSDNQAVSPSASDSTALKSWRSILPIHPAAEMFPPMSDDELRALGEDIVKNRLTSPIVLWEADKKTPAVLLDGRNRLDAIEMVIGPPKVDRWTVSANGVTGLVTTLAGHVDPYAYVISANIHRRHLTPEKKRDLIATLLKVQPEKSDRQIAGTVKTDHKTVGTVRAELEGRGEIPHVEKRTDTKGRQQPATKISNKVVGHGGAHHNADRGHDHHEPADDNPPVHSAGETKPATTFNAIGWWMRASHEERRHFFVAIVKTIPEWFEPRTLDEDGCTKIEHEPDKLISTTDDGSPGPIPECLVRRAPTVTPSLASAPPPARPVSPSIFDSERLANIDAEISKIQNAAVHRHVEADEWKRVDRLRKQRTALQKPLPLTEAPWRKQMGEAP